jgi:hypothetical protein
MGGLPALAASGAGKLPPGTRQFRLDAPIASTAQPGGCATWRKWGGSGAVRGVDPWNRWLSAVGFADGSADSLESGRPIGLAGPPRSGWTDPRDEPMMLVSAFQRRESIMHRAVHSVAVVVVVLHVIGGCCWHHAHAECVGGPEELAPSEACAPWERHGGHDHDAVHRERPCGHPHGCQTGPCVFVVLETGRPDPSLPGGGPPTHILPASLVFPCSSSRIACVDASSSGHLALSCRLHLLNRVLLL